MTKEKTSVGIYTEDNNFLWDIKRKNKMESLADAIEMIIKFYKKKKNA